ncbi:MAG: hypothetical protein JRJ49_08230 [Deltaproteobacteria bacterium]|nr:hypothetical protein [Deltaproteobacteria bacterium]
MANLKETEKLELEKFFKMSGGYVLDFTNKSFRQFVSNTIKIDIENTKYATNGNSKANRLKTLWQIESDDKVGLLTKEMLDYWKKKRT